MTIRACLLTFLVLAATLAQADPVVEISTLIGGSGEDRINDVAIDSNGDVLVVGATSSDDFPTVDGQPSGAGPDLDAFFLRLRQQVDAAGNPLWRVVQSVVLGGSDDDEALQVDPFPDGVVVRGDAGSADFSSFEGTFPGPFTFFLPRPETANSATASRQFRAGKYGGAPVISMDEPASGRRVVDRHILDAGGIGDRADFESLDVVVDSEGFIRLEANETVFYGDDELPDNFLEQGLGFTLHLIGCIRS